MGPYAQSWCSRVYPRVKYSNNHTAPVVVRVTREEPLGPSLLLRNEAVLRERLQILNLFVRHLCTRRRRNWVWGTCPKEGGVSMTIKAGLKLGFHDNQGGA